MTRALLGAAIVILAVALIGRAVDAFDDDTVDVLALVGLGLLAVGQAIRVSRERTMRSAAILLLVIALIIVVLLD